MNLTESLKTLSDLEIISRVISGEVDLYVELIRRYNSYLYKVGRSYGYSHADVEDLMQETHVNAYMNLSKFENRSCFKTWIVRIMLNHCYHYRQKSSFKNEESLQNKYDNESEVIIRDSDKNGSEIAQNNELKKVLEDAIQNVPKDYRLVFTLRELNGMSVRETSDALRISEGNVKLRFHRAKTMLQNEIKKTYSLQEVFEFNLIYCDKMVERVMAAIRDAVERQ